MRILDLCFYMNIDNTLLDNLTAQAQASPRLRMNLDLRNSAEDQSQRMLNALEPGTVLPIHRHCSTSETVAILRGRAVQWLYDDEGRVTEKVLLDYITLNVPPVALSIVPLQKRLLSVRQSYDYF